MRVTTRDKAIDYLQRKVEGFKAIRSPSVLHIRRAPRGTSPPKGRLGIFPASFNPPTKAHVALVREARKQYNLDEILVLLDLQAMDKKILGASLAHRLFMLSLLFRRDPRISIGLSNRGLFVEKLRPLQKHYPASTTFFFMVGFDTVIRIMDKKYYRNRNHSLRQLFRKSYLLVANRGEQDKKAFQELLGRPEHRAFRSRVGFFRLPKVFCAHSSSLVRDRIQQGKSVREWVPPIVLPFIQDTGLYKSSSAACE
jgi:nicotinate (nicotinamide) nucleotide adenylyltransferase